MPLTTALEIQLAAVLKVTPKSFPARGKTSEQRSQTTGPALMPKPKINRRSAPAAIFERTGWCRRSIFKSKPTVAREIPMIKRPSVMIGLRPSLSIKKSAINVENMFTIPIKIVPQSCSEVPEKPANWKMRGA